ncbi:AMP-binding protein [Pseudonocardia sp. Cha107L01]|uniref:AMP-binding protein n=1 Tax=Pseudonocardia sp. Cha107L01 TaxID=3457576 RepID=UPI00403E82AE
MNVEPAVRCGTRSRSHAEVKARAARVAAGLGALGVRPGDRVAVVLRNDIEFVEITLGTGLIGAVPVPVNWHWKGKELAYLLGDSEAKAVFSHSDLAPDVAAVLPPGVRLIEVVTSADVTEANNLSDEDIAPRTGHPEFESWLAEHEPWTRPPTSAPMGVIYTSGTTGNPKGILRAQPTPEQNQKLAQFLLDSWKLAPGMRTLLPTPVYHSAPNVHAMMSIALGSDLTFMPRFSAEGLLRLIDEHRIQHMQLAPTILIKLLALPEQTRARYDVSSLQAVVHGAAPCPVEVKKAMIDWWGPIFIECYGGSEAGIVTAGNTEDWLTHPGTVGAAVGGGADLLVLDPDTREPVPTGQVGEVFLKRPNVWPDFTYIGDPGKRAAMEQDGYWTLGDLGYLDEDGFLYLTDRTSDMVIFGGTNVYPAEIEECLVGLKGVNDVAVFGIPDAEFGEVLAAHLDVDPAAGLTQDDVRGHVAANLARYKVPRVVVFDNDLPREETGKLFKRRIRQRYLDAAAEKVAADA